MQKLQYELRSLCKWIFAFQAVRFFTECAVQRIPDL